MFTALVLICAATVPHGGCSKETALIVQRLPGTASLQQCMFLGQAQIAPTMIAPREGEYAKVVCQSRDEQLSDAPGTAALPASKP